MNLLTTTKKALWPLAVSAISVLSVSCSKATTTGKAVFADFDYHVTAETNQTDTSKSATPLLPGSYIRKDIEGAAAIKLMAKVKMATIITGIACCLNRTNL